MGAHVAGFGIGDGDQAGHHYRRRSGVARVKPRRQVAGGGSVQGGHRAGAEQRPPRADDLAAQQAAAAGDQLGGHLEQQPGGVARLAGHGQVHQQFLMNALAAGLSEMVPGQPQRRDGRDTGVRAVRSEPRHLDSRGSGFVTAGPAADRPQVRLQMLDKFRHADIIEQAPRLRQLPLQVLAITGAHGRLPTRTLSHVANPETTFTGLEQGNGGPAPERPGPHRVRSGYLKSRP